MMVWLLGLGFVCSVGFCAAGCVSSTAFTPDSTVQDQALACRGYQDAQTNWSLASFIAGGVAGSGGLITAIAVALPGDQETGTIVVGIGTALVGTFTAIANRISDANADAAQEHACKTLNE